MTDSSGNAKEISLGSQFGDVAVKVNGVRVEVHSDGSILAYTNRSVDAYTNGPVQVHPAANDAAVSGITPQIGDLDGGGVYVGLSASDGKPLHAALVDEPEYLSFDEALAAAEKMRNQPGRQNAHVPTPRELDEDLFANRNTGHLKNSFNTSGSYRASVYRSSAPYDSNFARVQFFVDGFPGSHFRDYRLPVRLVW